MCLWPGRLWAPLRLPPGSQPPARVLGPQQEPVSAQLLLQAVRKAACANHESDPGTPLLRTFERHSRETPRCSPVKALVPTGRCPGLGCASSLTSSPNRYGLPIAQVACALRCVPTCPCSITSLPSDSVTALLVSLKSPPGWYLLLIRVAATRTQAQRGQLPICLEGERSQRRKAQRLGPSTPWQSLRSELVSVGRFLHLPVPCRPTSHTGA